MRSAAVLDLASDTDRPEWQATRLAELVFHLTDCSVEEALEAVSQPDRESKLTNDEALAQVAAAIVALRR